MDIKNCNASKVGICCVDDWYSYCCLLPNRIHINGELFLEKDKCENCTIYNGYNLYNKNNGIQFLYIMLHNYCNAKCDMCDMCVKENKKYITKYEEILRDKNLNNVQKVVIHGGETFLLENELIDLIYFLKNKIKNKFVNLNIITNGTIYNETILNILNEFGFSITFSIDGFGEHNNMVRKGCDYNIIKENWNKIKEKYNNCSLNINYTLHTNNLKWLKEDIINISNDLKTKEITLNFVTYPEKISILFLDNKDEKLKLFIESTNILSKEIPWLHINKEFKLNILKKILEGNKNEN